MRDHRLTNQLKKGDKEAATAFVQAYYADVYRYIYFKLPRKEICEDLTQDTFLQFITNFDTYVHKGTCKAYLFRIAHNLCLDYFKSKSMRMNAAGSSGLEEIAQQGADYSLDQLRAYMNNLSNNEQEMLLLRYYYSLTYKEIGKILNMNTSTVKYHTKKALITLRKEMEEAV